MRKALTILLIIGSTACINSKTKNVTIPDKSNNVVGTENLLVKDNISQLVSGNHNKIVNITGDYDSFKKYIANLDKSKISSIPFALDYIKTCILSNNTDQDKIFDEFNKFFYTIANNFSDSLESKFPKLIEQLNSTESTEECTIFEKNLKDSGLELCSTEGTYYVDVVYDFFYNNFKERVTPRLSEFLKIRMNEIKQGFSEDASLLISFEQLYQRVKIWEKYLLQYPDSSESRQAVYFYQTYLETLLTGIDNSKTFDYDNNTLLPQVKQLYEKIKSEDKESQVTKIITAYYSLLERHNFVENDSIDIFLKHYGLSSMLRIQPHTR